MDDPPSDDSAAPHHGPVEGDAGPPRGDDAAGAADPTPTYARLRSEVDDDLGRWEAPVDRPDRSDPSITGVDVSSDEEETDGSAAVGAEDGDPGPTRQDDADGPIPSDEGRGFARPSSSPHTGSWEASPDPGGHRSRDGAPASTAEGHAEGDDETPAHRGPAGLGTPAGTPPLGASDEPVPPTFHGERPDDGTGDPPFHGEHGDGADGDAAPAPPRSAAAAVIEDALAGLDDATRHATVLCVANQKGGVGKTTTTVSLGAALAMLGAQVLVVDLDPQGNATTGLGLRAQEGAPSTYRVIVEQMDVEDAAEPTAVRGLHVLPSSLDLAGAEIELVPAFSRENRLKNALDAVRDLYDVVLIDCPPSLGLLTINALVAADQVMVPIQCEYYALEGLGQLMRTVKLVADSLNRGLAVGGVVLTMFDGRTNLSQQVVDEVRNYFGDVAYQTIVPRTVRLSEAPSYGQPIGVFDASSRGARAYERLAREVARRLDLHLEAEEVSPLDRLLGGPPPVPEEAAPLPTDLAPEDVPGAAGHPEGARPGDEGTAEPADGGRSDSGAPDPDGTRDHPGGDGSHADHHEQHEHEDPHEDPHREPYGDPYDNQGPHHERYPTQHHGHDEPGPGTEGWS